MSETNRQTWSASGYAENARFVSDLGEPLIALLDPRPGERVLDLGCGDGALTVKLAESGASVVGVDASPEFVQACRARGLDARLMDARELPFRAEFDAVFSNAVLHWIPEIDPVLDGVRRALRPAGRFVGELGGHGNVAAICTALRAVLERHGAEPRMPWYYPTTDDFRAKLELHGFSVSRIELIPRPTPLPTGMLGWLGTFASPILAVLPPAEQQGARDEVAALLEPSLRDSAGRWTADYVRLRFSARLA